MKSVPPRGSVWLAVYIAVMITEARATRYREVVLTSLRKIELFDVSITRRVNSVVHCRMQPRDGVECLKSLFAGKLCRKEFIE